MFTLKYKTMENIVLIITIVCFIANAVFLFIPIKGRDILLRIFFRILGIFGTLLPIHYWLNTYWI